ncbi:DNA endonuclease [Phocaeicola phage BV185P1]|nr:DNA endonuclease [Phocaeicola phage BV185P1]
MLTFEKAKELFVYDRETGIIKWRKRAQGRRRDNLVTGYTSPRDGYVRIGIKGKLHLAHRIAMLLSYGFYGEELQVDHISHTRDDNRLANLRFVTRTGNLRNQSRRRDNATGVTGVYYDKGTRKYKAQIKADGARIHLGSFTTLEEAAEVRKAAEIKYKFNANHGINKNKGYYVRKKANA